MWLSLAVRGSLAFPSLKFKNWESYLGLLGASHAFTTGIVENVTFTVKVGYSRNCNHFKQKTYIKVKAYHFSYTHLQKSFLWDIGFIICFDICILLAISLFYGIFYGKCI